MLKSWYLIISIYFGRGYIIYICMYLIFMVVLKYFLVYEVKNCCGKLN